MSQIVQLFYRILRDHPEIDLEAQIAETKAGDAKYSNAALAERAAVLSASMSTPKRFLVFAGEYYYPNEGWRDFRGDFDTIEEANHEAARLALDPDSLRGRTILDWSQVVDLETGEARHFHRRDDTHEVETVSIEHRDK